MTKKTSFLIFINQIGFKRFFEENLWHAVKFLYIFCQNLIPQVIVSKLLNFGTNAHVI